jgi:hypothetical protein
MTRYGDHEVSKSGDAMPAPKNWHSPYKTNRIYFYLASYPYCQSDHEGGLDYSFHVDIWKVNFTRTDFHQGRGRLEYCYQFVRALGNGALGSVVSVTERNLNRVFVSEVEALNFAKKKGDEVHVQLAHEADSLREQAAVLTTNNDEGYASFVAAMVERTNSRLEVRP